MKDKKKYILLVIIMMTIVAVVGTYAWLSYRTNDTAMVLTVGEIENIVVTLKPYKIQRRMSPTLTYDEEEYSDVEAANNSDYDQEMRLYYVINKIDDALANSNFKYTITRSIDDGNTYTEYTNGNFSNVSAGDTLDILVEYIPSKTAYKYRAYVWLDGSNGEQTNIQGKQFNGELRAEVSTSS